MVRASAPSELARRFVASASPAPSFRAAARRHHQSLLSASIPRMTPAHEQSNPMHGITLERMLTELVAHYGWNAMGQKIQIRCFTSDPSIPSSLKFLRRTPWARQKVEAMYRDLLRVRARQASPQGGGG